MGPFPIPAHRTERADFRHSALRLDSSHVIRQFGPRQRPKWQWFQMHLSETQDAIGFAELHSGKSSETLRLHLVATAEEVPYRLLNMVVHDSVGSCASRSFPQIALSCLQTSGHGLRLLGTRISLTRVFSLPTLFLDGPAPRYRRPFLLEWYGCADRILDRGT
jgi:hypothetical protein